MKAILDGHLVAESDNIVECHCYQYFPRAAVRMEWLEKAPRTDDDLECPHGVQFYDVVIDGVRHERAAWSYEAPRPAIGRSPTASGSGKTSRCPERRREAHVLYAILPPDMQICTRLKLSWVQLPESVPAFEVYYDTQALWPAASLERRRKILG